MTLSTPVKLAGFAAALLALFGISALAGAVIDPDRDEPAAAAHEEAAETAHEAAPAHGAASPDPVRGLAVADAGLRVVVDDPGLSRGRSEPLRFRIADEHGETVQDFDVEHEKRMHLILVRRDLTGFQHLHPEQQSDGSWETDAKLDEAGSYRLFADFSYKGEARTLASDLRVDGDADLRTLPAPEPVAVSDGGYEVRLDSGAARPGAEADLRFSITRDGRAVQPEPYLGAGGHLVALREGDLAFLHVHPVDEGSASFAATFPTEGRYRLFLQFKHEGRVQTVAFTQEVK